MASLLETLVDNRVIAQKDVAAISAELEKGDSTIEEILQSRGVNEQTILMAKGDFYGIPVKTLENQMPTFEVLKYVPEESASHYRFVPIALTDGVLEIGIVDPDNIEARDAVNFISTKSNLPFRLFLISESEFLQVLDAYKGISGEVTQALSEFESVAAQEDQQEMEKGGAEAAASANKREAIVEDAPVQKIFSTTLQHAVEERASDIHIEPLADHVRVRFRVDGVLNTSIILPIKVLSALVALVKIRSNMRLDEKRKPQDGRFYASINNRKIDFRVSTFPVYYGEKVVMRILDSEKGVLALDKIGMTDRNLNLIKAGLEKPYGMILISGPTGSGKSTTLYSMMNLVDRDHENVLSLEDPVEYQISGLNQSQVRPEIGYTFATGLRTTLRQDPDIIMVGEIRDKETAQLAVQAALTGHLVLSTIHTNNAAGVIPRLIDMGVDPFLIAPTLILAIAQRLVKTLCPGGGRPIKVEGALREKIEAELGEIPDEFRDQIPVGDTVYEAEITPDCPKGTSGRAAVIEVISMTKDLEQIILKNPVEIEIVKAARKQGMLTLREDAMIKAFKRQIPFEEVVRL